MKATFFSLVFLFSLCINAQNSLEKGYSFSKYFSPKQYKALSQNFDVIEDNRGVIYFGNNGGILEYDGVNFQLIKTPNDSRVRSLHKASDGTIYFGGQEEFGLFSADSLGFISPKNLSGLLPDTLGFGEVWNINQLDNKVVFQSDFHLFLYIKDSIQILPFENSLLGSFVVNGNLYVNFENEGLKRFMEGKFVPIPFSEKFSDDEIVGIDIFDNEHLIAATAESGFYLIKINPYGNELSVENLEIKFQSLIDKTTIQSFKKIGENLFAFGTNGDGLFVFDRSGKITQSINENSGIKDPFINEFIKDSRGQLRLALGNGVAFVNAFEPISNFGIENGLEGIIEDVVRYKGEIFCATHEGLFKLKTKENGQPTFGLLNTLQCWDLLPVKFEGEEMLLGAFNDGIYEVNDNGEVELIVENYPWKLYQSKSDSTLIFIGLDPGLGFIKYQNGNWFAGYENYDFDAIYNFTEVKDILWAGTFRDGLVYGLQNIDVKQDSTLAYDLVIVEDSNKFLPKSSVFTSEFQGNPLFAIDSAIFTYDNDFDGFKPFTPTLKASPGKKYFHRLLNQENEKLWAITVLPNEEDFEFGFFDATKDFEWVSNPLKIITDGIIHAIHEDSNGIVWLGGPEGLFRYDPKIKKDYKKPFKTQIRRVEVNRTTTIFGGAFYVDSIGIVDFQPSQQIPEFTFEENNLTFEFAAFAESDPEKHEYQYRLIGLEEEWSPPTNEPKAVYTNLEPGEYAFEVKSTNIYDVESNVATYQFSISPPWYQTTWYYAGQFGFIGLLVFFTIYLNRSKRDSEYTAVITFIGLITIFEFLIFLVEPLIAPIFGEVPIFQLLMNIALAISLNPVEYWVRGVLKKNTQKTPKQE